MSFDRNGRPAPAYFGGTGSRISRSWQQLRTVRDSPFVPSVNSRNRFALASAMFRNGMRRLNNRRGRFVRRVQARPSIPRAIRSTPDGTVMRLNAPGGNYNATSSGQLLAVRSLDVSGFDFTQLSNLWDEWRLVAAEYQVNCLSAPGSYQLNLITIVYDPDDAAAALSSYSSAQSYRQRLDINQNNVTRIPKFRIRIKALPNSTAWQSTGTSVYPGSIKMYGTNFTASSFVIGLNATFFVRFRTRRQE